MQAAKTARVRTEIRRQAKEKFCATCGKLIVFFPIELQGDSRDLARIIAEADALSNGEGPGARYDFKTHSPDNAIKQTTAANYGATAGQLGALPQGDFAAAVASPPYAESVNQSAGANDADARRQRKDAAGIDTTQAVNVGGPNSVLNQPQVYGATAGQIGALPQGDFASVISSPPYAEARIDGNGDEGSSALRNPDGSYLRGPAGWAARQQLGPRYGADAANLGNLPAGGFHSAISSPPFEDREASHAARKYADPEKVAEDMARKYQDGTFRGHAASKEAILRSLKRSDEQTYGTTEGNMGNETGATFWSAARTILEQCYAVLKPGAYAAFVTGDFVRNKQRVPFGEQWLALCEAVGFEPVLWAIAWKTEYHGTQLGLLGEDQELRTDRVSFFRRMANQRNPDAAILNEDILFVRKPEAAA